MNDDYQDLIELSDFYILSQRYDEAIKVLKKAKKIKNTDWRLYYNLGIAYEALHEVNDARAAFRLVLKLDPDHKSAQEHLDTLIDE
ncbi:tetratricopeptide repeat protein [candidate division WOR-3 bacterium]|nr:tetratricopeptide repeat protein [candidate division WOR-3 bacterium]